MIRTPFIPPRSPYTSRGPSPPTRRAIAPLTALITTMILLQIIAGRGAKVPVKARVEEERHDVRFLSFAGALDSEGYGGVDCRW